MKLLWFCIFLVSIALAQQSTETPAIYEGGKVTPIYARAVANRPMQTQAHTSIPLTQQQRYEIRICTLEAEVLQLQARLATERKAELIREAAAALKVPAGWLFDIETMRFTAPKKD